MQVVKLTEENFEQEVLKESKLVLIDVWAAWCGPCQMLSPTVEAFAKEQDEVKVCTINVDEQEDLAARYKVMNIPTLLLVENGEVIKRSVGLISRKELEEFAQK